MMRYSYVLMMVSNIMAAATIAELNGTVHILPVYTLCNNNNTGDSIRSSVAEIRMENSTAVPQSETFKHPASADLPPPITMTMTITMTE
jgi:hypothetical protein